MGKQTEIKKIIKKREIIQKTVEQRAKRHSILDNPGNIAAVKPVKQKAEIKMHFDKSIPLGPYNFPTLSWARYKMYGYKTDAAGIKHPIQWEETLPIGKRIRMEKRPGVTITGCERIVGGAIQK